MAVIIDASHIEPGVKKRDVREEVIYILDIRYRVGQEGHNKDVQIEGREREIMSLRREGRCFIIISGRGEGEGGGARALNRVI